MNDNIKHLRQIIKDELFGDEAIEFLDAIEKELDEKDYKIKGLEKEVEELEEKIEALEEEPTGESHIIGGLDVITIHLKEENIEVRAHVDTFIERLKKKYNSTQS